jgi:hypothetical protein
MISSVFWDVFQFQSGFIVYQVKGVLGKKSKADVLFLGNFSKPFRSTYGCLSASFRAL